MLPKQSYYLDISPDIINKLTLLSPLFPAAALLTARGIFSTSAGTLQAFKYAHRYVYAYMCSCMYACVEAIMYMYLYACEYR
jgi:hypothetical protein